MEATLGLVSILINNAGVGGDGLALDLSIETWDQTFAVNVRGVFFAAQAAARLMFANGAGVAQDFAQAMSTEMGAPIEWARGAQAWAGQVHIESTIKAAEDIEFSMHYRVKVAGQEH